MMDDLSAWLTQIWDERAKAARQALDLSDAHIPTASGYAVEYVWARQLLLDGAFQTAWTMPGAPTPAEVLAWIEADRQMLKRCTDYLASHLSDDFSGDSLAEDIAKGLALPHADRPGYQEVWRP